jgi:hypothetical protein
VEEKFIGGWLELYQEARRLSVRYVPFLYQDLSPSNPSFSPVTKSELPTLEWQNNCNVKVKVWFGGDPIFAKKRVLTFGIPDPNINEGTFSKQLTHAQWLRIRRLVGDISGSTIYWYVESRDALNRSMSTEVMSFELMD